ncbi:MAG: hypothetical protein QOJ19_4988 [Acidimicrobiia bacterium]|jgi:hypothetical protein|nr:hypothetical protein [Acidimicrobiia bacterium]
MYLRLGRLDLRSRPSYVMWLPSGYKAPANVYLVQYRYELDDSINTMGGFWTMREAEACLQQLQSEEEYGDIWINHETIHERLSDWQSDR